MASRYQYPPQVDPTLALLMGRSYAPTDEELGVPPLELQSLPGLSQRDPRLEFLASLSGLGGAVTRPPRSFGEGLAGGFATGLGGAAQRVAAERDRLEALTEQRRREINAQNLEATRAHRTERAAALKERAKETERKTEKQAEYERDNPTVGELKRRSPELAPMLNRLPDTERLPPEVYREIQKRLLPETPAEIRARAASERAEETARRALEANERANRLAAATTVGKMVDDYRADPAVRGFQNVRFNLNTAEESAKLRSGPGDIAMIFSYMRALEPENPNVVREGEYRNARQATGALQRVQALPDRFFKGSQLTDEGREYFLTQMRTTLRSRREDYVQANDQYKRRAEAGGVDPSLIIREYKLPKAVRDPKTGKLVMER
jgi:hypothetical protein